MSNKKTQKELFTELLNYDLTDELKEFVKNRIEMLEKKNSRTELTQTQKENLILGEKILNIMKENPRDYTVTELAKNFSLSTQKVTPILAKLIEQKVVECELIKKRKYYRVVKNVIEE